MRWTVRITLSLAAATATAAAAPAAQAKTVACEYGTYTEPSDGMPVYKLRAIDLPKKTSQYAPRCLVAESVASLVASHAAQSDGGLIKTVHPRGARWDAGRYDCTYEERDGEYNPYMVASCVSRNRKSRRVTFEMGS